MPPKRSRQTPPEKRQKVSTACDVCKKKKFKCNGRKPCELCTRKHFECTYTGIDHRSLKAERMLLQKLKQLDLLKFVNTSPITSSVLLPGLETLASTCKNETKSNEFKSLVDCKYVLSNQGIISYFGGTSSQEFAKEVRYIQECLGVPSDLWIPVVNNYKKFEIDSSMPLMSLPPKHQIPEILDSFNRFLTGKRSLLSLEGVSNVVDLIYEHNSQNPVHFALFYMIIVFSQIDPTNTMEYFKSAVILLKNNNAYDESLELVQAHNLVSYHFRKLNFHRECYYHLGIAISIAKLLDLYRSESSQINKMFASLAVSDSLCSILVGRTPHLNMVLLSNILGGFELDFCKIVNKICNQIYANTHEANFSHYRDICMLLKTWAVRHSEVHPNILSSPKTFKANITNLLCIILLCRPLFGFYILKRTIPKFQRLPCNNLSAPFFTAAIEASICIIELYKRVKLLPQISIGPTVVNSLIQSCYIIYLSVLYTQHFKDNEIKSQFNLDYLLHCLSFSLPILPKDYKTPINNLILKYSIKDFPPIDLSHITNFQINFVSQETAPIITSNNVYKHYNSLILGRIQLSL